MSRNYLRINLLNESGATLRVKHSWTSGSWTHADSGGWTPSIGITINPGESDAWQAEGDSFINQAINGVEARVWYDVLDMVGSVIGELYIFGNCPRMESQYGNTFHVRAPKGFYAAYVDAKGQKVGNRSYLEISFRNTKKVAVPGFLPSKNGFQFRNHWSELLPVVTLGSIWNRFRAGIVEDVADFLGISRAQEDWMPITKANAGLCGGMTFAVMDYFYANQYPPIAQRGSDISVGSGDYALAPDSPDNPLFLFIRDRLLDSFDFTGRGHRWLSYTSPLYPDGDEGVAQTLGLMKGKAWVTYREEWPRIRELLDLGKLVTIGLVQAADFNIGDNHQVLAYAYEQSGQVVKLWVYDPKIPGEASSWDVPLNADEVYLEFDITNTSDGITVVRHNFNQSSYNNRIYAILFMDNYSHHTPPLGRPMPPPGKPPKFELAEADATTITTGGSAANVTMNDCGEPMRKGTWTCLTTITFVAQVSGYINPVIAWKVNGADLPDESGSIQFTLDGIMYTVDFRINIGGRSISLTSRSGDTYKIPVKAELHDEIGQVNFAEIFFEVVGSYEGFRYEDIREAAKCFERSIPVPVDLYTIPKPGPNPDTGMNIEQWAQTTLQALQADASIDQSTRDQIHNYIHAQVQTPEISLNSRHRFNRNRFF